MANKIILKKSSVAAKAPVAGDLDFGELAINYTDSKLYFKKADGSISAFTTEAAAVTSVGGNIGAITDTQLLTSIKNVDGAGSGLDADFLDGNHASAFYLASNPNGYTSNTGTVTSVGATSPLVSSGGNTPSLSIPAANSTTNGFMSSAYASKLDGIAAGAQVNTVTSVAGKTGAVTLVNSDVGLGSVENKSSATIRSEITSTNVTTALGYTPYNASNPNGYITSSASISGNAASATVLQTARNINGTSFNGSANIDTTEWFHSDRDFPNGTLITTSIDYSGFAGDPFVLEIRGNSYGNIIPLDLLYQGYIYSDTIINHGGISNGLNITGLVAINNGGKLCFWFPSQGYWNGYNVKVYTAYATRAINRVTSITGVGKPTTAKEVALSANIRQSLHSSNYTSYAMPSGSSATNSVDVRAPIFYDSNDTGYYIDPNSTSNSALRMRGGALFGSNPTWGAYLYVGTNGNIDVNTATVAVTNGNLHLDAANGYVMYLNNYATSSYTIANQSMRSPIFYDSNNTGYYTDQASTSNYNRLNLIGFDSSGRNYSREWIEFPNFSGLYSPNNAAHFYPNNQSSYGAWVVQGSRNGWHGIHFSGGGGAPHLMLDGSGNGGLYFESNGRWASYHHYGNNCTGFGTSSTNSAYGIYVAKGGYFDGRVDGTIFYDANNTGYYTDPASTSNFNITQTISIRETRSAIAASAIDVNSGNYFTKTITGATTFTVNAASSGSVSSFILELTNAGSAAITWFSGVKWAGGTAPALTSAGVDILGFYTHDGGTTWRGMVLAKDSK